MAYDEAVAQRLRQQMSDIPGVTEKKMFGGIAFMVYGNMCCGVVKKELMLRIGVDGYDDAIKQPYARKMDFTGKPMKGFIYVGEKGFVSDADLKRWIKRACKFVDTLPAK